MSKYRIPHQPHPLFAGILLSLFFVSIFIFGSVPVLDASVMDNSPIEDTVAQGVNDRAYVADTGIRLGQVYRVSPSLTGLDSVYIYPQGRIGSLDFYDNVLYFVDRNGRNIYRTEGCQTTLVYTHTTYVRDIAFDSRGRLYFSEASGARSSGVIYVLDPSEDAPSVFRTIPLRAIDGFWAGDFAFGPSDVLYISSGNHIPASIYRYTGSGFQKMYTRNGSISGFTFVTPRAILFADYGQQILQLDNWSTLSRFMVGTGHTNVSDVTIGPAITFTQSPDWDGDGQGDACDCDDRFMGPNETGADCGGRCGGTCANCVPVIENGNHQDKIDVVFVPDTDYGGNLTQFRQDVMFLIQSGYLGANEINSETCRFNFYYYSTAGDYQDVCQKWDLPSQYRADCSFADSTAIVFTAGGRACSTSGVFSTPPTSTTTVVHETGHNIFGMADEYCCDGGYFEPSSPHPNIFHSLASCRANSQNPNSCTNFCPETRCNWTTNQACRNFATANGLDPNLCLGTCSPNWCNWRGTGFRSCCVDGGDGWWKSDPNTCYMLNGSLFEPDCHERVTDNLTSRPACTVPAPSALAQDEFAKVIILDYNIREGEITLVNSMMTYNYPPDYFASNPRYMVQVYSDERERLAEIPINDPAVLHIFDHVNGESSMLMGTDVSFTVVLTYVDRMSTVEIVDLQDPDRQVIITTDLTDTIRRFCAENRDDPQCG